MKKKILFVCMHNRFRSKVAEAAFKKFYAGKNYEASSAGIFKGIPVAKSVIEVGKELGLKINKKTGGLEEKRIVETDIAVIVANNVPKEIFKGKVKRVIQWKISDADQKDKNKIRFISKEIVKKVKEFVKELK